MCRIAQATAAMAELSTNWKDKDNLKTSVRPKRYLEKNTFSTEVVRRDRVTQLTLTFKRGPFRRGNDTLEPQIPYPVSASGADARLLVCLV